MPTRSSLTLEVDTKHRTHLLTLRLALVVFILIIGQEISTERFIRVFVRDYALQILHALRLAVRVFTLLFQYILDLLLSWSIHFPVVFKF